MATRKKPDPAEFIVPININGLNGRMLRLPASGKKKREILLVYGVHASIERMIGFAEDLNQYGNVTIPDLPGFGGMDSFYKIHKKPSLDNMADYLASFVKLRYKRKKCTIIAMSFGFVVATRMLQKYPELTKKVDLMVSLVGFAHKDDFKFSKRNYRLLRYSASFFSNRLPAIFVRYVVLRPVFIRATYNMMAKNHSKMNDADDAERKKRIEFEIGLWHSNDVRTYMETGLTMLTLDICDKQVHLPLYHISVDIDRYFDNQLVEQHLNVIYDKVTVIESNMNGHAPTVIADAETAAPFVPPKLRRLLARQK